MTVRRNLVEAHAHLASLGEALRLPNFADCRSLDDCLERVRRGAAEAGRSGEWFRATALRPEAWPEARWPTADELDAAADETPCLLLSFDHHEACGNRAAIARAGLRAGQHVEPNGIVCVDDRTGEPTGRLLEQAAFAAWASAGHAASATPQQRADLVRRALEHLRQLGYREVHDMHAQPWLGPVLAELDRSGALPLTVRLYAPVADLAGFAATRREWESDRVRLAGGKVFADGTLNGRTALLLTDYALPGPGGTRRGKAMVSPEALDDAYRAADAVGLPLAVHAIGDGAVRMVLDAIERTRPRAREQRIEHCELIDPADVPRFASMEVVCSVQPCHLLADVEALHRLLPHRLARVLPLRELIDAGCEPGRLLVFGSDAPIVRADPADSIRAAVHRRREGAPEGDAIAREQAITEAECIESFGLKW